MRQLIDQMPFEPKSATWELTLRCNLRCGHCGSSAGAPRPNELDRDEKLRTLSDLAALGCERLTLAGGEPTLSPDWEALAEAGAARGVYVNMITNGLIPAAQLVRRAKDAGLRAIGVSVDGLGATHDRLRKRPGLFAKVDELIDACRDAKLPVAAITTLWKGNRDELDALHDHLRGRVYTWQIQLAEEMGNVLASHDTRLAPKDLLHLVPRIASLIERREQDITVGDNLGYFGPYERVLRQNRRSKQPCWLGCFAGCRHVGIEADGGVKGCLSLQSTRDTEGNVRARPLADIWNAPDAFAYNRRFSLDSLTGFCRTCVHAELCRGGCRSLRACQGGGENRYCYHRVATEAEAARDARRYVPVLLAPAAVLAMFGVGCSSTVDTPVYSVPADSAIQETAIYSVPADSGDAADVASETIADTAVPDVMPSDAYGVPIYNLAPHEPRPDAELDVEPSK
jgi:radical SAM protein with 4Fe4S-binding SPASM domain